MTDTCNTTTTNYAGGYVYQNNALQFVFTPEGYATPNGSGGFDYVYQYKDLPIAIGMGNIRLSYTDKNQNIGAIDLQIVEENNYYPFGLKHKGYNGVVNGREHKYKFNNREWQDELGLNVTAMDFRQYDIALGRFNNLDMLAELSYSTTPYRFAFNNPIFWADPSGLFEDQSNETLAICPTCPNTPQFQDLIDDPNNTYFYDTETGQVSLLLDEVVVKPYKEPGFSWWGLLGFGYMDGGQKSGYVEHTNEFKDFIFPIGGGAWVKDFLRLLQFAGGFITATDMMQSAIHPQTPSTMENKVAEEVKNVPDKVILTLDRYDPIIELQWGNETVVHRTKRKDTAVNSSDGEKTKRRNDSINKVLIDRAKKRYKNGNK